MKSKLSSFLPQHVQVKTNILLPLIALSLTLLGSSAFAIPARILIVRHAEKPMDSNDPNLSPKGTVIVGQVY